MVMCLEDGLWWISVMSRDESFVVGGSRTCSLFVMLCGSQRAAVFI
jgi:hypothetical protein